METVIERIRESKGTGKGAERGRGVAAGRQGWYPSLMLFRPKQHWTNSC